MWTASGSSPANTLFVTSPYTLPYQIQDAFNQFTLYSVLEHAGFYLPHPSMFAPIGNDKLATLLFFKDCPVPPIPTVRITAGRDLLYDEFLPTIENLPYPAFVKPSGWMAARGINLARNADEVRGLLSLAQGGDTTLVFQPYLGAKTVDYRVHVIDGKPVHHDGPHRRRGPDLPAVLDGCPGVLHGDAGRACGRDRVPGREAADPVLLRRLPARRRPVLALRDRADGAIICPDGSDPEVVRAQRQLIKDRFLAYGKVHAQLHGSAE